MDSCPIMSLSTRFMGKLWLLSIDYTRIESLEAVFLKSLKTLRVRGTPMKRLDLRDYAELEEVYGCVDGECDILTAPDVGRYK